MRFKVESAVAFRAWLAMRRRWELHLCNARQTGGLLRRRKKRTVNLSGHDTRGIIPGQP